MRSLRWCASLTGAPLLLCACAVHAMPVRAQSPVTTAAETEVRKLERAWLDAYERHDVAAMTEIVANDFMITYPDGTIVDKLGTLGQISGPVRPGMGPRFSTEKVQARVYGDTVILSGILLTKSAQAGGPPPRRNRYTDTYVRLKGRWKVVTSHLSNLRAE